MSPDAVSDVALRRVLAGTEALLLDFDGPICSGFAGRGVVSRVSRPARFVGLRWILDGMAPAEPVTGRLDVRNQIVIRFHHVDRTDSTRTLCVANMSSTGFCR